MKKILFLFLSLFGFWFCSATASSVVVNAWGINSWIYWISHNVSLSWSVSGIGSWCSTTYLWTQEANPFLLSIDLINSWALNASFIAPDVSVGTVMKFKLTVNVSWCSDAWTYDDVTYLTIDKALMTANAWADITVTWWSIVTLAWTWYWWYCLNKFYKWYQTWANLSPDLFDESSSWANNSGFNFTAPVISGTISFTIALDYGCGYWTTWTDLLTLTVTSDTLPVSTYNNWWSVKFTQALNTFNDVNLKNIKLILEKNSKIDLPLIELYWNSLWAEWVIQYEVQYSTNNAFINPESKLIYDNKAYFISYDLEKKSDIWYFRVKASYNDKSSDFSNTYIYFTNPLSIYKISSNKTSKVNFEWILNSFKNILDVFQIKCENSCKKINF